MDRILVPKMIHSSRSAPFRTMNLPRKLVPFGVWTFSM